MLSIYETTAQGQQTRSQLLQHIAPGEELTREQLMSRANLTYEQVRRQTKNLSIQGVLQSRIESGKRVYRLRSVSGLIVALLMAWSVSVGLTNSDVDDDGQHLTDCNSYYCRQSKS